MQDTRALPPLLSDFIALTKPRVVALIMLTAIVGAALAAFNHPTDPLAVFSALLGIAIIAAGAAAFNCLAEIYIDKKMKRTRSRPLPAGRLTHAQAILFATLLSGAGLSLTLYFGGALLGVLTLCTFLGYALIYTVFLKPLTPQNIVIGGASGAMPPLLGWVAVSQQLTFEPLLLFLIIFVWTPPHFWALALYRQEDYAAAKVPMLPVTHGVRFTTDQICLYSVALFVIALLPYASRMSGLVYLAVAIACNVQFLRLAFAIRNSVHSADAADATNASPDRALCQRLFVYSIHYLGYLFVGLLVDKIITTAL